MSQYWLRRQLPLFQEEKKMNEEQLKQALDHDIQIPREVKQGEPTYGDEQHSDFRNKLEKACEHAAAKVLMLIHKHLDQAISSGTLQPAALAQLVDLSERLDRLADKIALR